MSKNKKAKENKEVVVALKDKSKILDVLHSGLRYISGKEASQVSRNAYALENDLLTNEEELALIIETLEVLCSINGTTLTFEKVEGEENHIAQIKALLTN